MKPLEERVMSIEATHLEVVGHSAPGVPMVAVYAGPELLGTFDLAGVRTGQLEGAGKVRIRVGHLLPIGKAEGKESK